VIFQRFLRHIGAEGVIGVRQGGKGKGHGMMSATVGDVALTDPFIEGSIGVRHPQIGETWPIARLGPLQNLAHRRTGPLQNLAH
jgi:hypothetical protein